MKIRSFIFCAFCLLLLISCKKKEKVKDPVVAPTPAPAVSVNSTPFVEFTLDGTVYKQTHGVAGFINNVSSSKDLNSSGGLSKGSYGTGFHTTSKSFFSWEKGTMSFSGSMPEESDFKAFFAVGNSVYSPAASSGVNIKYWDANGTLWSTDQGTKDQTGSAFKIESVKEQFVLDNQVISLLCTFNCKLYDDNGNTKTLTAGRFVGAVENN